MKKAPKGKKAPEELSVSLFLNINIDYVIRYGIGLSKD